MSQLINMDSEYKKWVEALSRRFKQSQIKAAVKVNRELLAFYWLLGKDIVEMKAESRWGSKLIDALSADLRAELPMVKGFSATNLRYVKRFYALYVPLFQAQVVTENVFEIEGTFPTFAKLPQVGEKLESAQKISPQVGEKIESSLIFSIPWGHHKLIIDRCGKEENLDKAIFYVRQTVQNNWSRAMLLNFLDTDLYERQGKAITNFKATLPPETSELAQELTKDPYSFDFLTLTTGYREKELKDALMDNITKFLLELGKGFAFVGREYRLMVGKTEQFIDMLFYNITLHAYVVIEVKVAEFEPRDIGQVTTYVAAVDGILRGEDDAPTIGLLICKTKDDVLAKYATTGIQLPVGISEYEIAKLLPENFKSTLPTIEEIENELKG